MLVPIVILTTIVCVLLTLVVLVQNPKGGGLSATFGGFSPNLLGAQRTTDILEKATWYLAIFLIALSLLSEFFVTGKDGPVAPQPMGGAPVQPFSAADWENTAWPFGGPVATPH